MYGYACTAPYHFVMRVRYGECPSSFHDHITSFILSSHTHTQPDPRIIYYRDERGSETGRKQEIDLAVMILSWRETRRSYSANRRTLWISKFYSPICSARWLILFILYFYIFRNTRGKRFNYIFTKICSDRIAWTFLIAIFPFFFYILYDKIFNLAGKSIMNREQDGRKNELIKRWTWTSTGSAEKASNMFLMKSSLY